MPSPAGSIYLREIIEGVQEWMIDHGYSSMAELRGCMSYRKCPDPGGYERANYLHILQTWQVGTL